MDNSFPSELLVSDFGIRKVGVYPFWGLYFNFSFLAVPRDIESRKRGFLSRFISTGAFLNAAAFNCGMSVFSRFSPPLRPLAFLKS